MFLFSLLTCTAFDKQNLLYALAPEKRKGKKKKKEKNERQNKNPHTF